jgi:hypothetical protein
VLPSGEAGTSYGFAERKKPVDSKSCAAFSRITFQHSHDHRYEVILITSVGYAEHRGKAEAQL